jgi:phosphate-selective porin OprO/OprP
VAVALACPPARALGQAAGPPVPTPAPAEGAPEESPEALARRVRALEEANRRLVEQAERSGREMAAMVERFEALSRRLEGVAPAGDKLAAPGEPPGPAGPPVDSQPDDPGSGVPDYRDGAATPDFPVAPEVQPLQKDYKRLPLQASFGPGFRLESADEEYMLQVEYESQIEGRVWSPAGATPANSGFYFPRQRFFFRGRITKPLEYEISINRGLNAINILNAYVNLHLDDRFELRFGRFFTPLAYEQYAISNYWLLTPERSPFTTNLNLNRQVGLMAWGYLLDKRLDYAAGVFNGSRNSFENLNDRLDYVAYLNARPFQDSDRLPWARFLNVGGSVAVGDQDERPAPSTFRIAGGSPDTNIPGIATVPFLILNPGVIERGNRVIGSAHAAYFHRSLSVVGEWQFGHNSYATAARPDPTRVPVSGFYVAGGYFLTGEEAERRTRIRPLRPLIPLRKGDRVGPGAWEAVGRVARVGLDDAVFAGGFADPARWSSTATTTELGLNWYWNDYTKIYLFWLHGRFGDPVEYRAGDPVRDVDMFWARFQLYF